MLTSLWNLIPMISDAQNIQMTVDSNYKSIQWKKAFSELYKTVVFTPQILRFYFFLAKVVLRNSQTVITQPCPRSQRFVC